MIPGMRNSQKHELLELLEAAESGQRKGEEEYSDHGAFGFPLHREESDERVSNGAEHRPFLMGTSSSLPEPLSTSVALAGDSSYARSSPLACLISATSQPMSGSSLNTPLGVVSWQDLLEGSNYAGTFTMSRHKPCQLAPASSIPIIATSPSASRRATAPLAPAASTPCPLPSPTAAASALRMASPCLSGPSALHQSRSSAAAASLGAFAAPAPAAAATSKQGAGGAAAAGADKEPLMPKALPRIKMLVAEAEAQMSCTPTSAAGTGAHSRDASPRLRSQDSAGGACSTPTFYLRQDSMHARLPESPRVLSEAEAADPWGTEAALPGWLLEGAEQRRSSSRASGHHHSPGHSGLAHVGYPRAGEGAGAGLALNSGYGYNPHLPDIRTCPALMGGARGSAGGKARTQPQPIVGGTAACNTSTVGAMRTVSSSSSLASEEGGTCAHAASAAVAAAGSARSSAATSSSSRIQGLLKSMRAMVRGGGKDQQAAGAAVQPQQQPQQQQRDGEVGAGRAKPVAVAQGHCSAAPFGAAAVAVLPPAQGVCSPRQHWQEEQQQQQQRRQPLQGCTLQDLLDLPSGLLFDDEPGRPLASGPSYACAYTSSSFLVASSSRSELDRSRSDLLTAEASAASKALMGVSAGLVPAAAGAARLSQHRHTSSSSAHVHMVQ